MELTAKKLTPDELDAVLRKKDLAACRDFFKGASEKERKAVAARAMEWHEVSTAFEATGGLFMRAMIGFESQLPKRMQLQLALTKKVESGELIIPSEVKDKASVQVARLAVTACCSLTEIRKCGMAPAEFAFEVMRDRQPKFFDKWLNFACERSWTCWQIVRAIERHGFASAERDDAYWNAMAYTLGQKNVHELSEYLNQDDELRDTMLWIMLENASAVKLISDPSSVSDQFRTTARNFNSNDWNQLGIGVDEANRASFNWKLTLIDLAQKGLIDKAKLLACVFESLGRLSGDRDSKPTISYSSNTSPTQWYQQIHDELNLSQEEMNSFVIRYISLLSVRDMATLSWSIKSIAACSPDVLPLEDLFAGLPRVFYHKRKEPALAALQLVDHINKSCDGAQRLQISEVVVEAFEHPSSEIHKKALSFLKKTKAIEEPLVASLLEPKLERLNALIRKELLELIRQSPASDLEETANHQSSGNKFSKAHLGIVSDDDESTVENSSEPKTIIGINSISNKKGAGDTSFEAELQELISTASSTSGDLADCAELPAAVSAAKERTLPAALILNSFAIPRLDQSKTIKPVETLDELIYLCLHVVERSASTDDGERMLDGISRLHHLHPPEFEAMVSSLQKKLTPLFEIIESQGDGINVPYYARAIHSWLSKRIPKESKGLLKQLGDAFSQALFTPILPGVFDRTIPSAFLSERALAIGRMIKKGKPFPLLAAPTHCGGWIDPMVLPERLETYAKQSVVPDDTDVVQALLRIAPDRRAEALEQIPPHKAEYIRAIRWALGAELSGDAQTPHIWVAALRCREPEATNEYLKNRFRDLGPDSAQAATYADRTEEYARRANSIYGTSFGANQQSRLPVMVSPEVRQRAELRFFPTELLHVSDIFFDAEPMLELYYPINRESFFANQANRTAMFLTSSGTYWTTEWNALFDRDVSLTRMGTWMLVISLSAKQPEAARLALDATIAGIDETRIDGKYFGFVMARFFRTGLMTLSRWITAFKDIARISPLHTEFCLQALESCLANIGEEYKAKPPVPMIECLYDCAQSAKSSITDASCREFLEGIQSKGKAAKLAKLLLDHSNDGRNAHIDAVNIQILQSRLDRIRIWSSRKKDNL